MLLDNYKKQSPIVGVAGLGGGINSYIFLSSGEDYVISKSLRFNSGDSAYLNRTPSSASNRKTWTWSGWVKRSDISATKTLWASSTLSSIRFATNSEIEWLYEGNYGLKTNAVFRDISAWYHFVFVLDTTNSTADDRQKIYVNGTQLTSFASRGNPSLNSDKQWNAASAHAIGAKPDASVEFDGHLAEINFVDGQALSPTDFGEFDTSGVWQPKKYSGSYGTNGFHLDFKDSSSNAALGYDAAGSNNFTVNNLTASAPGLATANQGMDVVTYTGNAGTKVVSGLAFQPDLLWLKRRDGEAHHYLVDSVRGLGTSERLASDRTDAGGDGTQRVASFNSDGFTVSGNYGYTNISGGNYVAWAWKAGGSASSNTDGTLTSQVSANTTYGFSIVKFTMGSSDVTCGHGLAVEPKFIITKRYGSTGSWITYHASLGKSKYMMLNSTAVAYTDTADAYTSTNSSVFDARAGLIDAGDCISYVWSEIAGFSKFGTFTHSGGGQTLDFGFTPRYWLVKETDGTTPWYIFDAERDNFDDPLYTNTNGTEGSNFGFTFSGTTVTWVGGSFLAGTYIYSAFAAKPDQTVIDSLLDSPSQSVADETDTGLGGQITGNYATLNPLDPTTVTLSNGNLDCVTNNAGTHVRGTIGISSGKWYWEVVAGSSPELLVGICTPSLPFNTDMTGGGGYSYYSGNGNKYTTSGSSYGASWTTGDTIGVAFDADAGTLTFYKNGSSQGQAFSGLTSGPYFPAASDGSSSASSNFIINFGQRAFSHAAPSGYKALTVENLPTPTIADGSKFFDTKLVSGNSSTQTISGLNFSPDFVWAKSRSHTTDHYLFDTVRGATNDLKSNSTSAEGSNSGLTQFNSDGYNIGSDSSMNTSGRTYVNWAWDAGTSTVTNNDGSIASQVRANPAAGFSIVTYSGNESGATVGHGLNAPLQMIWIKQRTNHSTTGKGDGNWIVGHVGVGMGSGRLILNDTYANDNGSSAGGHWNSTAATSSVFSVGSSGNVNGSNNATYVAYCFAPIEGYSAMGSYIGNSNVNGPFVYTGFRPSWIMFKPVAGHDWVIMDVKRDTYNIMDTSLYPNAVSTDTSSNPRLDILSNGFKIRSTYASSNPSGTAVIYAAFAEHPFNSSRAR